MRVQWRGVLWFLAIAFGCTWTVELIALERGVSFSRLTPGTVGLLGGCMCFPAIAAFVTRRWILKEGFASAGLRLPGSAQPYVRVLLGIPLLFLLVFAMTWALHLGTFTGDPRVALAQVAVLPAGKALPSARTLIVLLGFSTLVTAPFINAIAAFGEEFGWTGFLLPHLLPLGRWRAVALYAVIWGLWHAPLIVGGYHYQGHPRLGVPLMCVFTFGLGMMQCALLLTYRSVLLTSLLHGCVNSNLLGLGPTLFVGVNPLLGGPFGVVGLIVVLLGGAFVLSRTSGTLIPLQTRLEGG